MPTEFSEFPIRPDILSALHAAGFVTAFPIQELTLPLALARQDIIGQAKTGTGKTLGFGIPLLQAVVGPDEDGWSELAMPGKPQALVVVPTRELALQVADDLEVTSRHRTVRVTQVYGGRAYEPQVKSLMDGTEVVVGTPGRILDLMRQGHLDLTRISTLVLDEADKMLDLGFLPDVEAIIAKANPTRQTMLFSATMPSQVVALARRYMSHPAHIRAEDTGDTRPTLDAITQVIYRAHVLDKPEMVARILQAEGRGLTIIFTHTKRTAARLADDLTDRGFAVGQLHGDMGQGAREQAMRAFRNGKVDVLVATDVAARGLDIDDVSHVINYECPDDEHSYIHRIGRTGRAGRTGTAVTLVDWEDTHRWGLINKSLEIGVPEPAETYSSSEWLFTDLNIPAGTKGRLPKEKRTRAGLDAEYREDVGETGKRSGKGRGRKRDGDRDRDRGRGRGKRGDRDSNRDRGRDAGRNRDQDREREQGRDRDRDREQSGSGTSDRPESGANGGGEGGNRPRRRRQRRRTRGGQPVSEG